MSEHQPSAVITTPAPEPDPRPREPRVRARAGRVAAGALGLLLLAGVGGYAVTSAATADDGASVTTVADTTSNGTAALRHEGTGRHGHGRGDDAGRKR